MTKNRNQQSKTTSIRLSERERELVQKAADARVMGVSTFARIATLQAAGASAAGAKRRRRPGDLIQAHVLGKLGRIAGQLKILTQEAKGGGADTAAMDALRSEFEMLRNNLLDEIAKEEID